MARKHAILALQMGTLTGPIEVDRDNGIIRNVAVITLGTTKPSATTDASFDVDTVTLQQVADAINASEVGVKSRITHVEVEGVQDDLPHRVGYIRNARVVGNQVRGDAYLHDPESTEAIKLMDIAENDPTSIGLSIAAFDRDAFTVEPSPTATTGLVLRVSRLDAVDWVGKAAANPAGLLSAKPLLLGVSQMNEKQREFLRQVGLPWDATDEQTAAFIEALSEEQKAQFAALKDDEIIEDAVEAAESAGEGTPEPEEDDDDDASSSGLTAGAKGNKPKLALSAEQREAVQREIRNAARQERERVREIRAIALACGYDEKWINHHIDRDTPIGEVRRLALASLNRSPQNMPTYQVKVGADLNRESLDQAVQDAIMLRAGVRRFVEFDAEGGLALAADSRPKERQPHPRAAEFRGHSLVETGRRYLLALGYRKADQMNKAQLVDLLMSRARLQSALSGLYLAHATGDFPGLLADTMGKVLRARYALAPATWTRWANRTTAPDFKEIKKLQLSGAANLTKVPEGGEIEYGTLAESKEVFALSTFAKGIKFTRQMLINDDLSAFNRVPTMLGDAAARLIESLALAVIIDNAVMADGSPLFSTAHANLTTGTLSVANLGAARAVMRKQTDLNTDDPLELMPRVLLVPEALFVTASQLVASTVDPSKYNATPNPFANQLEVISSPRLDLDSTTEWYLIASPDQIDTVDVCFLEGQEEPQIFEEDEFDTDVRKIKVRQDAVAHAIDYRGMVRSNGVDPGA